jgi:hypothetical protein
MPRKPEKLQHAVKRRSQFLAQFLIFMEQVNGARIEQRREGVRLAMLRQRNQPLPL